MTSDREHCETLERLIAAKDANRVLLDVIYRLACQVFVFRNRANEADRLERALENERALRHDVRDFLGHANITTTSRYLKSTPLRLEKALARMETAIEPPPAEAAEGAVTISTH